jgi:ribosomal protein S27AE
MLTNRRNRTFHKSNIEQKNYTPFKLRGLGPTECPICGFQVETSTMIKNQNGRLVCGRCFDGFQDVRK